MIGLVLAAALTTAPADVRCADGAGVLTWEFHPTSSEPATTHFEVERQVAGTPETWGAIGSTRTLNRAPYVDEGGVLRSDRVRVQWWPVLRGSRVPIEGVSYDYRVRAVSGTLRSEWSLPHACGTSDPTRCYRNGLEEPCP
jgi:hypothetical protein